MYGAHGALFLPVTRSIKCFEDGLGDLQPIFIWITQERKWMAGELDKSKDGLPHPLVPALKSVCPNCAKGPLFDGFLKARASCTNCGADFSKLDTADGPAVFIILVVSVLVIVPAVVVELIYQPPYWVFVVIFLPLIVALPLLFLRPFKALMFALQFRFTALEGRIDDEVREESEERGSP